MNRLLKISAAVTGAAALFGSTSALALYDSVDEVLEEFELTGKSTSCLSSRQVSSLRAVDENHFVARVGVNRYYLNRVSGRCNGADRNVNFLKYRSSQARLCSNEIITVVDNLNGFTVGSCSLGKFEELKRIEKPAEEADDPAR